MDDEELKIIRRRLDMIEDRIASLSNLNVSRPPSVLGTVYDGGSIPTTLPKYFLTHPTQPRADQTEGTTITYAVDTTTTRTVAVFGDGPGGAIGTCAVPAPGTRLISYLINSRWCSCLPPAPGGGTVVSPPGCPCASSPATLNMTVVRPDLNNGIFNSCAFHYGATPANLLPVVLTPMSYLSTTTFTDPVLSIGQPQPVKFSYLLTCYFGAYVLTRVYVTTPLGSPFRDGIRYTWIIGLPPTNKCAPFALPTGTIFSGGDTRTTVSIGP